jgi:hypothetical protein
MISEDFDRNVFINCAFDDNFKELFRAIVFTIHNCGFIARCALEKGNKDKIRINKILSIIEQCKYGIHDLSCVQITKESPLPRYNMPYELGVFMGCKKFGNTIQKTKDFLVLDSIAHRYKQLISDLAGYDFPAHSNDVNVIIKNVRDWLSEVSSKQLPGAKYHIDRYKSFLADLPKLCSNVDYDLKTLIFTDYYALVSVWIQSKNSSLLDNL